MSLAELRDAVAWLESHVDFERVAPNRAATPTLQPIIDTLTAIGSPQMDYPVIHITGTNGKGTTSTLTSALLREMGLAVGTFTSPDLHAINERISVNGEPISDDALTLVLRRLRDLESVTGITLTRFEILTVAALLHFSDEGVEVTVIEVGLGGTWDSTNVINGSVSVLTNVDLDHTAILGPTVEHIARDKVGIFRAAGTAVLATTDPRVVEIASARADELGCPLIRLGRDFDVLANDVAVGGRLLTIRTPRATYDDVVLTLHGAHQGVNATTALVATEEFIGEAIGEKVVRSAFGHATMPGRLEVLARSPLVVVDGAHNPAGARALAATLDGAFGVGGVRRVVFGLLNGREVVDMVEPLVSAGLTDFHVAAPDSPRAMDVGVMVEAIVAAGATACRHDSVAEALGHAREIADDADMIVCAGSLYVVAEARAAALGLPSRLKV